MAVDGSIRTIECKSNFTVFSAPSHQVALER